MPRSKEILSNLKKSGFRLTKPRTQLVHFLLRQKGHWSIQELSQLVAKAMPEVGAATVYRTVSLLQQQGVVHETKLGAGASRYEVAPQKHHDHLTCLSCGEIFEFQNEKIEELQTKVAKELGFSLEDHRMELYGECLKANCRHRHSVQRK